MQKIVFFLMIVGFFLAGMFSGCQKIESYSDIPHIEFKSARVYDTIISTNFKQRNVAVSFSFVDGDGDIGYRADVADSTAKNNLYFSRFEQRGGRFVNVDSLLVDSMIYSIPYDDIMSREGQNKTMKGTIKVDISELVINYDTIRYDFYILDRAKHKSNVASTSEIVGLKKP